jgi:murein DD-endopeptidase MepM/ murein hydrolase activator NlpD
MRSFLFALPILLVLAYVARRSAPDETAQAAAVAAAVPPLALDVTWSPEAPRQGTLFTVRASAEGGLAERPSGRFADQRLHFERDSVGEWWAVAAVPVDAEGVQTLHVEAGTGPARAEVGAEVPVAAGEYAMERLSVAPRFSALDSATEARTERESARAIAVAQGAHDTPRLWRPDALVRPRPSRITSGFGNGREFNGEVQSRHMGTDFAGAIGEPVLAAADGVVRIVDEFYLGGRVVYLDHGGGLSSAYLHLSAAAVAIGDTVTAGQRIGSVGASGRVTGPHLHWIVRYGGVTVDPLSLLELSGG